jgi:hypothetical protein
LARAARGAKRADRAAGAVDVFHYDASAEMPRQNVGNNSAGDIGRPTHGKWDDHRNRSGGIVLGLRAVHSGRYQKNSRHYPMPRHVSLPAFLFVMAP